VQGLPAPENSHSSQFSETLNHEKEAKVRPGNLRTRIFLDGGDPEESEKLIRLLGFLDGQTTNPTLISKNPDARLRMDRGKGFTEEELLDFYCQVVQDIARRMPEGSISVEVYARPDTPADRMLDQARKMFSWIPNAQIKFPCSHEGLKAAQQAVAQGIRVNMTLCFSQEQAAAVYAATRGANRGDVYLSPFVGRLDDRNQNGMALIENILRMYRNGDGHVEVLGASVRSLDHLLYGIHLGCDIITAPYKILNEWGENGLALPDPDYRYAPAGLRPIPYEQIDLDQAWHLYEIDHELTTKGMEMFSEDWDKLII